MTKTSSEALERCATLLDAVVRFIEENPIVQEYTVIYDDAECDGLCLSGDCDVALEEVRNALAKVSK